MVDVNGQTVPADAVKAMGAAAARVVLSLPALQQAAVVGQVRDQRDQVKGLGLSSPWHEGFLDVIIDHQERQTVLCPGCSGAGILTDDPQVLKCQGCGGFFTGADPITFDQALKFVRLNGGMLRNAGPDGSFYFDLTVLDVILADGKTANRLHGWADTKTKQVVQWG